MKDEISAARDIRIHFLTKRDELTEKALKTLTHVYPGITVKNYEDYKNPPAKDPSVEMIDTEFICGSSLDLVIDQLGVTPVILMVKDFASVRSYSKYLSSRVSLITEDDVDGMGLIQATHHLLERQRLHKQLRKTSKHLKELSIKDELTGFFNNRHFHELLTSEIKKSNRYKRPLAIVITSIKNFSTINKLFGHNEGDRVMAKSSDLIRSTIRDVDICARYGDNEFALILPESNEEGARIVTKRINDAIADIDLGTCGRDVRPILSCGIATLSASVKNKDDLLGTALGALLEAKRIGETAILSADDIEARRRTVRENRQLIEQLSERISRITKEAQRNYFQSLVGAIGEIPLLKKLLMHHSERVAFFAKRLAESRGMDESTCKAIYRAGLLHDAGKLAIDPDILTKPDKLSFAEQELVQRHPVFAIQIMGSNSFLSEELPAILHHHERYDGNGYPERLSGESIPISARILGIAEAWDVMTTPQPYRQEPLSMDAAMAEIEKGSAGQFDPELVDCFKDLVTG
ncbi:MAG: diguanylate cyclase [Deltaproteobacteria bacterium]|jgi:diguanylate cyclase (GGDEF)-like protein|nr:diguanylate cyclase [Deltaproteobacteria bacterium]